MKKRLKAKKFSPLAARKLYRNWFKNTCDVSTLVLSETINEMWYNLRARESSSTQLRILLLKTIL